MKLPYRLCDVFTDARDEPVGERLRSASELAVAHARLRIFTPTAASPTGFGSAEQRERVEVGGRALVIGRGEITLP